MPEHVKAIGNGVLRNGAGADTARPANQDSLNCISDSLAGDTAGPTIKMARLLRRAMTYFALLATL